jgi:hypothetical protein
VFALLIMLVVGVSMLVALAGYLAVHRLVPVAVRASHNEVAGAIYAGLGGLYGVLLAFVLVAVWGNLNEARATVEHEANALSDLSQLAEHLPNTTGQDIQTGVREYARLIVEEWHLLARGQASRQAQEVMADLRQAILGMEPASPREVVLYQELVEELDNLSDNRQQRLFQSRQTIASLLWVILVGGGVIMVGHVYFFGSRNSRAHALMVVSIAAVVAIALVTVWILDRPYWGHVHIGPQDFTDALDLPQQAHAWETRPVAHFHPQSWLQPYQTLLFVVRSA